MKKNIHVSQTPDGRWQAKKEGADRASKVTDKQSQAINAAEQIARREKTEMFIHGRDGKIRERNTYGKDPFPPGG